MAPKLEDYNAVENPSINKNERQLKTKKSVKISRKAKFFLCSLVLSSFVFGLALTSLAVQVSAKGNEINSIKNEINTLQINNERLQLEKKKILSLENIEMIAVSELQMVKPEFENLQMVTVNEMSTGEVLLDLHKPAEYTKEPEQEPALRKSFSISIVTSIAKAFSDKIITKEHQSF